MVALVVGGQDFFPEGVNGLGVKGGVEVSIVDSLVYRHDKELFIFSDGSESGCVIERPRIQVVLVIAVLCFRALLLKEAETPLLYKNSLTYLV